MENIFKSKKMKSLLPYLIIGIAIVITHRALSEIDFFIGLIHRIWTIFSPFVFGFVMAYIVSIPCNAVQRLLAKTNVGWIVRKKKALSILLVFLVLILLIALVLNLIVPVIADSISYLIENAPVYHENILEFISRINAMAIPGIYISTETVLASLQDFLHNISPEDFSRPFEAFVGIGMSLFRGLLAVISLIYILHEKENFKVYLTRVFQAILPIRAFNAIMRYLRKLNNNFKQYIYTQTIDGCILGAIATTALYFMGSPFFLILGLMLGILNYIPYFGSIVGSLIAIVVVAFTQGFTMGLIAAIVLLVIQQIDANLIQPKLMSGPFSLSPFLVIVSITVGGAIAGMFGMIAAIPIVSVLRDIFENIVKHYEAKREQQAANASETESDETDVESQETRVFVRNK